MKAITLIFTSSGNWISEEMSKTEIRRRNCGPSDTQSSVSCWLTRERETVWNQTEVDYSGVGKRCRWGRENGNRVWETDSESGNLWTHGRRKGNESTFYVDLYEQVTKWLCLNYSKLKNFLSFWLMMDAVMVKDKFIVLKSLIFI